MRLIVDRNVAELPAPPEDLIAEARAAARNQDEHDNLARRFEALHAVELVPPPSPLSWPNRLVIAAWNAERGKFLGASRALLDSCGAHAALMTELDVGMARSGNVHTVRTLAGMGGEGFCYGVEFVELDLGDPDEMKAFPGQENRRSLHGNAIVSRLALTEARLIALEAGGRWFDGWNGAQHRVGGRMAIVARVAAAPRPLWLVSVHLESRTDPQDRAAQAGRLVEALKSFTADAAVVIGGDFNTKELPHDRPSRSQVLSAPQRFEPLFSVFEKAGFTWREANTADPTQRTGPSGKPEPPFCRLDWLFLRGCKARRARVVPAVDSSGSPISDHELVVAEVEL